MGQAAFFGDGASGFIAVVVAVEASFDLPAFDVLPIKRGHRGDAGEIIELGSIVESTEHSPRVGSGRQSDSQRGVLGSQGPAPDFRGIDGARGGTLDAPTGAVRQRRVQQHRTHQHGCEPRPLAGGEALVDQQDRECGERNDEKRQPSELA